MTLERYAFVLLVLGVSACSSEDENPASPKNPVDVVASSGNFTCTDPNALAPTPTMRLSRTQYESVLVDLFGQDSVDGVAKILADMPFDMAIEQPSEFAPTYERANLDVFYKTSVALARAIASSPDKLTALGADCVTTSNPDDACMTKIVGSIGRRVFRRPLGADEVSAVVALARAASDSQGELSAAFEYLLQSPDFLYRLELGAPADQGKPTSKLTAHELASRLAFSIWDSEPDAELDGLADSGALDDAAALDHQVDRMLLDPRAHAKLAAFVRYWLELYPGTPHAMRDLPVGPEPFLDGLVVDGLRDEVVREAIEFVDDVVYAKKGSWADLMTSTESFARTDALAAIYGHPKVDGTAAATMAAPRKGLLMRPLFLADSSPETNPIIRGVRTRSRVLCMDVGAPPANVISQGPDIGTPEMLTQHSTRERYAIKTSDKACAGCHVSINPFGFVFEGLDPLGRFRKEEVDYGADGSVVAKHAIDTTAKLAVTGEGTWDVQGPEDYVSRLATSDRASSCFVKHLQRFYTVRDDAPEDACRLASTHAALTKQGGGVLAALKAMFVYRTIDVRRSN